jgi:hypothetical protein
MDEKKKVVYSEERLEKLKQAREKANAIRTEKAEEKKKIKLAEQIEHLTKVEEAEKKLKSLTIDTKSPSEDDEIVVSKKKKKKKIVVESSSDESSGSEAEIVYVRPKKKMPSSKPIAIPAAKPAQAPLTPHQIQYIKLYKNLFG